MAERPEPLEELAALRSRQNEIVAELADLAGRASRG
jgi:hypothetical protein